MSSNRMRSFGQNSVRAAGFRENSENGDLNSQDVVMTSFSIGQNKVQSPTHFATSSILVRGGSNGAGGSTSNAWAYSSSRGGNSQRGLSTVGVSSMAGSMGSAAVASSSKGRTISDSRREGLKTILTFLSKRGYPNQINPKTLNSPTRALYLEVLQFIISQYDPRIKISKPDDEIPRFFKDVGYPVTINKTTIIAPGAPNTWPQHIAAMSWLCELLDYEQAVFPHLSYSKDGEFGGYMADTSLTGTISGIIQSTNPGIANGLPSFEGGSSNVDSSKLLSQTLNRRLSESYKLFLNGQNDGGLLNETLEAYCRERKNQAQQALEKKKHELEQMNMEIQKISHELQEGELLLQRNHTLSQDLLKMEHAVSQCKNSIRQMENSCNDAENVLNIKKKELRDIEDEVEKLQKRIANQGIQRDDVSRVYQDMKVKRQTIRNLRTERENTEKENWEIELSIEEHSTNLYNLSRVWNSIYQEITNITSNEIRANEVCSFGLLQPLSLNVSYSGGHDKSQGIDGIIGQNWSNMKHSCKRCIVEVEMWKRKLKTQEVQFSEIMKSTKDTIIQKKQACDALEKKIKNLDGDLTVCDKREMRQLEQIQEKVRSYKAELDQNKDEALKRLEKAKSRIIQLEQQSSLLESHSRNEIVQCKQVIQSDAEAIFKLKEYVIQMLSNSLNSVSHLKNQAKLKNNSKLVQVEKWKK
ncbi:coiled coil protein [Cryptosporidium canis]|uniref:Kinetochore protein NDC80 n=1 Tax=Cryptosporidium canis TaxID=195482 RepID=A0ABQ8P3I2_9CRYT|nr:coiled coil protein [Cryptosporidium canis]KAJ1609293.1 coiled coil protein [Cryptosporidium canis]